LQQLAAIFFTWRAAHVGGSLCPQSTCAALMSNRQLLTVIGSY